MLTVLAKARSRISPVAIRRALYADRWVPRYRAALQRELNRQVRQIAAEALTLTPDVARHLTEWETTLDRVKRKWIYPIVITGYELAGREVARIEEAGKSGGDVLGKADVPPPPLISPGRQEGGEFLLHGDFESIDKWVATTSVGESQTSASKLEKIWKDAVASRDPETGVAWTPDQISKQILRRGLVGNRHRADMLARTGAIWSVNEGAQQRYRAAGVKAEKWLTTKDDALCFVAGTRVSMEQGSKPIERVEIGDAVLTRSGNHQVTRTMRNIHSGPLTVLVVNGEMIVCTNEHPIWVRSVGWVNAGNVSLGDIVYLSENKSADVVGAFDLPFLNADNRPSALAKILRFAHVFSRVLMPIISVYFKSNLCRRYNKINAVRTNRSLLNELDTRRFENITDSGFNASLSSVPSVAGKGTVRTVRRRDAAKRFPAVLAQYVLRRAVAFFRAVLLRQSTRVEYLSTTGAGSVSRKAVAAFPAAYSHPERHARIDLESLSADGTDLYDSPGFYPIGIALSTTELSVRRALAQVECLPTSRTCLLNSMFRRVVVALVTTICVPLIRLCERLATVLTATGMSAFHLLLLSYYSYRPWGGKVNVYNLEIEHDHTFFANGVLVHNCPFCQGMDGKVVSIDEPFWPGGSEYGNPANIDQSLKLPYDVQHPPLHPRCRCSLIPVMLPGETIPTPEIMRPTRGVARPVRRGA